MSDANPHQGYHAQLLEKLEGLYRENVTLRDTVTRLHLDCDLEARKAVAAERNNAALRNEIARLNGQTNWVCKCGGTDCAGQRENAALREWVKEEGRRNDVCTYGILKEVCEDCRCGKRKEAQP